MNQYTVDRFEGEVAVLLLRPEEEKIIEVPIKNLPSNLKEGDIIEVEFTKNHTVKSVAILKEETSSAKKRAEDLIQKLINKNKHN